MYAREIPATDFGTVIHKVLEECAGDPAYRVATDAEEIGRMLSLRLDHVAPRYFGDKPSPVVRVQLESMRVRLLAAADTEARIHAEGWQILAVEHKVRKEDKRMLGGLAVAGTMDRVERHPVHGLRILDYKTYARAKNPRKTHIGPQRGRKHLPEADFEMMTEKGKLVPRSWTDLQLPLYVWLARQIWPEDAAKGVRVGYFLLPPETDAGKDSLEIFALDDAMEKSAIRCAARVAELVKDGRFWPPSPAAWVEFDDFAGWFADADPALLIDKESAERLNVNPSIARTTDSAATYSSWPMPEAARPTGLSRAASNSSNAARSRNKSSRSHSPAPPPRNFCRKCSSACRKRPAITASC